MPAIVEVNKEIMYTLIELLKQGGPLALWGLGIWLVIGLVKVLAFLGTVYLVVSLLSKTVLGIYQARLSFKASQISVLTQQVSEHLMKCLEDYHKSVTAILSDIDEHLKNSKGKSNTGTV